MGEGIRSRSVQEAALNKPDEPGRLTDYLDLTPGAVDAIKREAESEEHQEPGGATENVGEREAEVRARQDRPTDAAPFRPKQRASLPRLHNLGPRDRARLPAYISGPQTPEQPALPGFGPVVESCPSGLLWMFDQAGGQSMKHGRGAPWPMRLFVGALLHLGVSRRDGPWRTIRFPTDEALGWLHPTGWSNRRRDWGN